MRQFARKTVSVIIVVTTLGIGVAILQIISSNPKDVKAAVYRNAKAAARPSTVVDIHGRGLGAFVEEARYPVHLKDVPLIVRKAFIAAEDKEFYSHFGISPSGLLRSLLINFRHEKYAQGGSTITQQLVRTHLLSSSKSMVRKIREIDLAIRLERQMSKNQIFELWLNSVYFGNNAWGIEAASRHYFNKKSADLSLSEGALLAGLVKAPSKLAPHINFKGAIKRREYVLDQIHRAGWISKRQQFMANREYPTVFKDRRSADSKTPWITESARLELWKRFELQGLPRSGFKVQTSVDMNWQLLAERLLKKHFEPFLSEGMEASFVVIDPGSGDIRAMVGGIDFSKSQFNRVTQMSRPLGGSLFPLIFAWAGEAGITTVNRAQSLGAAAIQSNFQDADRVAAALGYNHLKERFLDAGVKVSRPTALEDMSGTPLTLAQGWRVLTGRPIRPGVQLLKTVKTNDGTALDLGSPQIVNAPGIGDAVSYSIKSWLVLAGSAEKSRDYIRYKSEASWNSWNVSLSDKSIAVLWAGPDAKPPANPVVFQKMKRAADSFLDEWLSSTGQIDLKQPTNQIVPNGLSWHLLRSRDGRVNRVPFPTSF